MKIGLKYPVYAPATENDTTISYSAGTVLAKAISAKIQIKSNDVKGYGDDGVCETDQSFSSGTVAISIDDLYDYAKVGLLSYIEGAVADAVLGSKELSAPGDANAPYVGFGYYGKVKRAGLVRYRAIWLKKVQFAEPNDEMKTKGEKTEFLATDLEGIIMVAVDGNWKDEATFSTEAAAKAWLNAKAGLPVTTSGGLTALALTGTGGTLSPAFGASLRSYTFGGLTGTSFTITPTAAEHTLKLYVDGVYSQTIASGAASTAIAFAAVGSKHLQLVSQETGKAPVVYDIIVVKTA